MPVRLIESLSTTEPLDELFSDRSVLQAMLDFEVALARAEAKLKIIPSSAARAIAKAAQAEAFDVPSLARGAQRSGTPVISFVSALRKRVQQENPAVADFVHWGATSQDVSDSASVLLLRKAAPILDADLDRLERGLGRLAKKHKNTVMLGRTLMQPAPPITFGLKAAGWLGSIQRGRARLKASFSEALILQFGGASGTLAALGNRGIEVGELVAKTLKLEYPDAPWHTHRDRLAAVLCACGILTGSMGKMARDISLMMQSEVGEVLEPGGQGRGGSSTMPHKRNPVASTITLAAANRVPSLVSAFLSQMIQEHERSVGGSQAEWPTVAAIIQATGVACSSMAEAVEGLRVNARRMKENLESTRGAVFAEKAVLLLSSKIGREAAHQILEQATKTELLQNRTLSQAISETPEVNQKIAKGEMAKIEDPHDYLGVAREFTLRLSRSSKPRGRRK